jgi:hypothetical protein
MRSCQNLSQRQREHTPYEFARILVEMAHACRPGSGKVAALWTRRDSVYFRFFPYVEVWGVGRNANLYQGPFPIVSHPPCGPWGKYRSNCFHSKEDGVVAMRLVHVYGGVVEQPVGSSLFAEHGSTGYILRVNQGDYGHMAIKPTLLYVVTIPY